MDTTRLAVACRLLNPQVTKHNYLSTKECLPIESWLWQTKWKKMVVNAEAESRLELV